MPSENKYFESLANLHFLVKYALDSSSSSETKEAGQSTGRLQRICDKLKRSRTLAEEQRQAKIGVFGVPKRGKSTLLNVFLGDDILPSGDVPVTRCAIEMKNSSEYDAALHLLFNDGKEGKSIYQVGMRDIKDKLAQYVPDPSVLKIEVEAPFCSPISQGAVFVDTPGAESGFQYTSRPNTTQHGEGEAARPTRSASDEALAEDTHRALAMLEDVDVVIFCARADMLEKSEDVAFYKRHLEKLDPINVITFRDECEDVSEEDLIAQAVSAYGFLRKNTVLISGQEALKAFIDFRQNLDHDERASFEWPDDVLRKGNIIAIKEIIEARLRVGNESWAALGLQDALADFVRLLANITPEQQRMWRPYDIYIKRLLSGLPDDQSKYTPGINKQGEKLKAQYEQIRIM